ncbi:Cytochrome c oxidase subunit 6A, mitochondrial [Tolypocladium capitatum]|uniref:Cytochrome c oxidase subunit 6A, mitochondrial n=1 Tax=Tolypocladium capitatum TaxID=45235 RepID=A0A2K3Q5A6_9HYPO|nr:Cytochrome c oxidase subunit 6A, mitochondrial [Tolypocladium capitatum]
MPPLEERTEYPYQNIRTKNYQWGDGDKTLFWNENVNYHNKDKVA